MPTELTVLAYAALLQGAQFILMAIPANSELGPRVTLSPRDGESLAGQLSNRTARLYRALSNHFEGLILFTIAVLVVTLADRSSPVTEACAWAYLVARIAYVPAYAFGWSPWRSLIWMVGFLATYAMLLAALFSSP